jgi:ankyrin repeat protein
MLCRKSASYKPQREGKKGLKNDEGEAPPYFASIHNHAETVKLLLDAGADPRDKHGRTPPPLCRIMYFHYDSF